MTPESSDRLTYEILRVEHSADLADALLDPRVYSDIDGWFPRCVDDLIREFTHRAAGPEAGRDQTWWNFAVRLKDGPYVGRIEATEHAGIVEVGYLFGPQYWGRGYATESVRWLEAYVAKAGFTGSFWATVAPANERSVRMLERIGYEEVASGWPVLLSYYTGDRVFVRRRA